LVLRGVFELKWRFPHEGPTLNNARDFTCIGEPLQVLERATSASARQEASVFLPAARR
jgi:hypothetical protein